VKRSKMQGRRPPKKGDLDMASRGVCLDGFGRYPGPAKQPESEKTEKDDRLAYLGALPNIEVRMFNPVGAPRNCPLNRPRQALSWHVTVDSRRFLLAFQTLGRLQPPPAASRGCRGHRTLPSLVPPVMDLDVLDVNQQISPSFPRDN
jgi:hypothetical protein